MMLWPIDQGNQVHAVLVAVVNYILTKDSSALPSAWSHSERRAARRTPHSTRWAWGSSAPSTSLSVRRGGRKKKNSGVRSIHSYLNAGVTAEPPRHCGFVSESKREAFDGEGDLQHANATLMITDWPRVAPDCLTCTKKPYSRVGMFLQCPPAWDEKNNSISCLVVICAGALAAGTATVWWVKWRQSIMGEGHSSHCIEGVRSWEVEGGGGERRSLRYGQCSTFRLLMHFHKAF